MQLAPGTRLGHYEIVALIGSGGMGAVYRAKDTRLGRDVAIKVSADRFSERFEREARAIAALNHPNICTLHDVGSNYLVMEYIEGESPKGPMPVDEVLRIAHQVARALAEAHEKRITHRDLKPGNIKVKADGTVKVLDFGLAKMGQAAPESSEDSPTLTLHATLAGTILGTAAYMAPEQARGKPVDRRADIWAFGVVLYELSAGKRPFKGDDLAEILASVVKDTPDLTAVPPRLRSLIRRCLEKDPKKRLQDIGDFELLLMEEPTAAAPATNRLPWIVAGVAALALAGLAFVHFQEKPPEPELARFEVPLPSNTTQVFSVSISPDGNTIAASMENEGLKRIWLRPIDSLDWQSLKGTDGAGSPVFWSSDSRFLIYSGAPPLAQLILASAPGGVPRSLLPTPGGAPLGTWAGDAILFSTPSGLEKIPASGGKSTTVAALDKERGEQRATSPSMLPDGKHFLYFRVFENMADTGVYVGSLDEAPDQRGAKRVAEISSAAQFVPAEAGGPAYIAFLNEGRLMVQEFDPERWTLAGSPTPIAENVGAPLLGNPWFSFSNNGKLVYRTGDAAGAGGSGGIRELRWHTHDGKPAGVVDQPGRYNSFAFSRDGSKRLAIERADAALNNDLWIHNMSTGSTDHFTFDRGADIAPVWEPNGSRIAFASDRNGNLDIYLKNTDLSQDEVVLLNSEDREIPLDWSPPDGRFLLYSRDPRTGEGDLWVLPMEKPGAQPWRLFELPGNEMQACFSPEGDYIAYVSNESKTNEVYVRSFSAEGKVGAARQISNGGGTQPRWAGNEIFYISPNGHMMSVSVTTKPAFAIVSPPRDLFATDIYAGLYAQILQRWDIAPDGRFLINSVQTSTKDAPITVVLNWRELLKKK